MNWIDQLPGLAAAKPITVLFGLQFDFSIQELDFNKQDLMHSRKLHL